MSRLKLGSAFLIDTSFDKKHLYFVLFSLSSRETYLFASITSLRTDKRTCRDCLVSPYNGSNGIPPFVKHDSVVSFDYLEEYSLEDVEYLISRGFCIPKGDFSEPQLKRIQTFALRSGMIPNEYLSIVQSNLKLGKAENCA